MQAGQRSRLQTATEDKSLRLNFFSFASKSVVLRIILICSSAGNDSHNLGNESSLAKFGYWFWSCWWFRSWISFSPILRIDFFTQVLLKEMGRKFWINLRCIIYLWGKRIQKPVFSTFYQKMLNDLFLKFTWATAVVILVPPLAPIAMAGR